MLMFLIFIKINDSECMGIQYDILFIIFILKEENYLYIYTDIQNSSILTFNPVLKYKKHLHSMLFKSVKQSVSESNLK